MKISIILLFAIPILLLTKPVFGQILVPPVKTVAAVDLQKYLGRWFEAASIPQSFQKDCLKNTTADYENDPETDYITVINSCDRADGSKAIVEGRARAIAVRTKAQLEVTFVKLGDWVFAASGDYWIIGLDKNYLWAVVGDPKREYAWILSRSPNISRRHLKHAAQVLEKNGYNLCDLKISPQDEGREYQRTLCAELR